MIRVPRLGGVGTAITIETSEKILAPPAAVWPWLVDWENLHLWMLEASDFKVTSSHTEGVGVSAEATIRIAGFRSTDPIRVRVWEPASTLEIEHLGWVKGSGRITCTPVDEGATRLDWKESLQPPWGSIGRWGLLMLRGRMRSIFQRDLRVLKQLVEGGAPR